MPGLDPKNLAAAQGLAVKARIIVEGALSGLHRARLHGSSVEFAEHKEYSQGDELKHIDWKTYAKNDRYYVKQYEQESELTVHLILDASASMSYAGNGISKLDYASLLFAALSYLLIRQSDKVGLLVFGNRNLERYVPPRARPAHLHDLLRVLEEVENQGASGGESVTEAIERAAELVRRRRSLIVIASDLFDANGQALSVLSHLRARGHDVALFHVLDDDELMLPFEGLTKFESLESERHLLAHPAIIRKQYRARLREFLDGARKTCADNAIEYRATPTSTGLDQTLLRFLTARMGSARPEDNQWDL